MFASNVQEFHIFRLDQATQSWTDTDTLIDTRNGSKADVLWNGSKLYVVSAGLSSAVTTDDARFIGPETTAAGATRVRGVRSVPMKDYDLPPMLITSPRPTA